MVATYANRGTMFGGGIAIALNIAGGSLDGLDRDMLYGMRDHCDCEQPLKASRELVGTKTLLRFKKKIHVVVCKSQHSTEAGEGKNNAPPSTTTSSHYRYNKHYRIDGITTRYSITANLRRLGYLLSVDPSPCHDLFSWPGTGPHPVRPPTTTYERCSVYH